MLLPPAAVLYPHACTIYRFAESRAASGKPNAHTLSTTQTGIACHFQTGQSTSDVHGALLDEMDNMFTLDKVRFDYATTVDIGDVLKQTTGPEAGVYWMVKGNQQVRSQFGDYITVFAVRLTNRPIWVP